MISAIKKIELVKKKWSKKTSKFNLEFQFLQIYYKNHPKIKHLFLLDENLKIYAQIFKLNFSKTKNYLKSNYLFLFILRITSFKVLYLTNSFLTTIPFFYSEKKMPIKNIIDTIKDKFSLIIVPDFFAHQFKLNKNYIKVEVSPNMILDLNYKSYDNYILSFKRKYRNKINQILNKTKTVDIKQIDKDNIDDNFINIEFLFNQTTESSSFSGPTFNCHTFKDLLKNNYITIYGFFVNKKLIGFSSYFEEKESLHSYYIGFNREINKLTPIYGRIILHSIETSFKLNKKRVILGRTANEYKSNFGAKSEKSYVYILLKNKFLHWAFKNFIKRIRYPKWTLRKPFKEL